MFVDVSVMKKWLNVGQLKTADGHHLDVEGCNCDITGVVGPLGALLSLGTSC